MNDEREQSMIQPIFLKSKFGVCAVIFALALAAATLKAENAQRQASAGEDFYIISSVNLKKNQLVLKRPTEVTVLMEVNDKTTCLDEKGKSLHLKDLRAGDTVFFASRAGSSGDPVAMRIRKGYMTLEEVHSRYLNQ